VLTSMQECRQFRIAALVTDERVGLEHSFEPRASVASLVPNFFEMLELALDLTFVQRSRRSCAVCARTCSRPPGRPFAPAVSSRLCTFVPPSPRLK
jgi:hypothetical protein